LPGFQDLILKTSRQVVGRHRLHDGSDRSVGSDAAQPICVSGNDVARRIGCQHTMVAVAVQPWRRDQGGEMIDELQRGEGQRGASVALGLRQTLDDPVVVDLFDALKGKRLACTVARPLFQTRL
jgi:hypothetical protein